MKNTAKHPLKERALQLADKVGPAEAARRLNINHATLRTWRYRAGQTGPPQGITPVDWAEAKREGAWEAWETARTALKRVRELLRAGKMGDAQRAALTMAILTDKSGVLELATAEADRRAVRLSEDKGRLIVDVLARTFADMGFSFSESARRVAAHYLRQAVAGEPLEGPAPDAERARSETSSSTKGRIGGLSEFKPKALPPPRPDDAETENVVDVEPEPSEAEQNTSEAVPDVGDVFNSENVPKAPTSEPGQKRRPGPASGTRTMKATSPRRT